MAPNSVLSIDDLWELHKPGSLCPRPGCAPDLCRSSLGTSRARGVRSTAGSQARTRAAAEHGVRGEAAGHARAKANTRRIARGCGARRGRDNQRKFHALPRPRGF